jgi:hypothetical protein
MRGLIATLHSGSRDADATARAADPHVDKHISIKNNRASKGSGRCRIEPPRPRRPPW